MKTLISALLFSVCLFAQNTARVEWVDGTVTDLHEGSDVMHGTSRLRLEWNWFDFWNTGNPWNWNGHIGSWPNQPVTFKRVWIRTPQKTLLTAHWLGARPVGDDTWLVVDPSDFLIPHRGYPAATTVPLLDGGDRLSITISSARDPYPDLPGVLERAEALTLLHYDEAMIARWPWLKKLSGLMSYSQASVLSTTRFPNRDMGWKRIPLHFVGVYQGLGPLKKQQNWYMAGCYDENLNYDEDAALAHGALSIPDRMSWALALGALKQKLQFGFHSLPAASQAAQKLRGHQRTESGDRRGVEVLAPPDGEKSFFDRFFPVAWKFEKDDPLIQECGLMRQDALWSMPDPWAGRYGGRMLGWPLDALRCWFRVTDDQAFRTKAAGIIDRALLLNQHVNGTNLWLANQGNPLISCHEESCLAIMAYWIVDQQVCPQHETYLRSLVEWELEHCGIWNGPDKFHVGYLLNPLTGVIQWGGRFQGCHLLAMRPYAERWWPGRYGAMFDAIERDTFSLDPLKMDACSCCDGGDDEGASWEQKWPFIAIDGTVILN